VKHLTKVGCRITFLYVREWGQQRVGVQGRDTMLHTERTSCLGSRHKLNRYLSSPFIHNTTLIMAE
jgi:hypothetical protein